VETATTIARPEVYSPCTVGNRGLGFGQLEALLGLFLYHWHSRIRVSSRLRARYHSQVRSALGLTSCSVGSATNAISCTVVGEGWSQAAARPQSYPAANSKHGEHVRQSLVRCPEEDDMKTNPCVFLFGWGMKVGGTQCYSHACMGSTAAREKSVATFMHRGCNREWRILPRWSQQVS
jgi:hypothetical protein